MVIAELLRMIEQQTGAIASVDALHPCFYDGSSLGLAPEQYVHRGGFCEFAKRHSSGANACCVNKSRSREIAGRGRPFSGVCPHGLWEHARPVLYEGIHLCTLYLGHFASPHWSGRVGDAVFNRPAPAASAQNLERIRGLSLFADQFIRLEFQAWLASGNSARKQRPAAFYAGFCNDYIERNYRENIQLQDIASALRVSPNYLSSRIRQECGRRFSELLTDKRLQTAATYLEFEPRFSVTDVAFMCGFRDSNYFSTVFHRRFGVSPLAYRNQIASS